MNFITTVITRQSKANTLLEKRESLTYDVYIYHLYT